MRSGKERTLERGAGSRRRSPVGGKSLQRLFEFLGTRNPALNDEIVASVLLPKAARPRFQLTPAALRAPIRKTAKRPAKRKAGGQPAAKLAKRLMEAAAALEESTATAAPGAAAAAAPLWRFLGPKVIPNGQTYGSNRVAVSGRVSCVAIDPSNRRHLLCGAAGGGIWESTDNGASWTPRTDRLPSLAIGAIAFDPGNPQTVYAGSGEGNFYFNLGAGVYRSLNGGTTWGVIATAPFIGIGFFALVVDPADRNTLYAATTNGFYRSTNGGATWTQKRPGKCWTISLHPAGGPAAEILATFADGLFVSTNGGGSFAPVALPSNSTSFWRRLAVDRVASTPDVAYVFGAGTQSAHLWRRLGTTWTKITTLPTLKLDQAWYDWYVAAPSDTGNEVFIGAIDAFRGRLSGTTWQWKNVTTQGSHSIHPDQHCLAFSPGNPRTIYAGNDGGLYRSDDDGDNWTPLNDGLGITEVEYMASDPATSNWLLAGTQDNGTIRFSAGAGWNHVADGDGGDCGVNPLNAMEVYHSFYKVSLERSNNKGNSSDSPAAAERAFSVLPAGQCLWADGCDRRCLPACHSNWRTALADDRLGPPRRRCCDDVLHAGRGHDLCRYEIRCPYLDDLEWHELGPDVAHRAVCRLYELHRRRSRQSAAALGNLVSSVGRQRHGEPVEQQRRPMDELHGRTAAHTQELSHGRSCERQPHLGRSGCGCL